MSSEFKTPSIDYTSRDYSAIRDDAVARIPFFLPEWTDRNATDPGIVLLQLWAGGHDVLHYYLDQKIRENFITDVRGRKSLISLATLVGQRVKGKAPAKVLLDFTLQAAQANPTPIPVGTLVASVGLSPTVFFETTESAVIPAGELSISGVQAVAGQTFSAALGTSNGEAYQEFEIPATSDALDDGMIVEVDGTPWTFVEALGQALPSDEKWSYRRDVDGVVYIQFGNGTVDGGNGLIPDAGLSVVAYWREGGGLATNVGSGVVRTVVTTILSGSNPVAVVCNNPKPASGGDEEELVKLARKRIPRAFRANDRVVVAQDLEALAEAVPGVVHASAYVSSINQWTCTIVPQPTVGVGTGTDPFGYAVLATKEQSDAALAQYVHDTLARKLMETDYLIVKVARFKPVDISATINLLPGANRAEVEARFVAFVNDFFDVRNRQMGRTLRRDGDVFVSDWDGGIEDIVGVDNVDTTSFQLRPQIETVQAVGDPLFTYVNYTRYTGDAVWEVLFLDALTYRVYRQDIFGGPRVPQSKIGAISETFHDDNGEIEFIVSPGAISPMSGDRFRFRSSAIRGNLRILDGEMAVQGAVNFSIVGGS